MNEQIQQLIAQYLRGAQQQPDMMAAQQHAMQQLQPQQMAIGGFMNPQMPQGGMGSGGIAPQRGIIGGR